MNFYFYLMNSELVQMLSQRRPKNALLEYCTHWNCWEDLVPIAFCDDKNLAWRAIWLLTFLSEKELAELEINPLELMHKARKQGGSFQREVFKLLEKLSLTEEFYGYYMEWAIEEWCQLKNPSSVRIAALRAMVRVGQHYPELLPEIKELGHKEWLEGLSPAIGQQAQKIFTGIRF
jgi:hypothetical protein